VRQLVGVGDRADARDLTAGDIERQDGDQPLLCIESERSRPAVDLDGAQRHARKARAQGDPVDLRARDAVASAQRARERRYGPGTSLAPGEEQFELIRRQRSGAPA
jgi:hypothetical protein